MITYEEQYLELIGRIMSEGELEHNARTGHDTRRIIGTLISCDLRREWPLLSLRKMYPKSGAAEMAWMLMGTQSGEWLKRYSRIWEKFEEEGKLLNAYGYRWRRHFGRDQVMEMVNMLKADPSSRQGVCFAWDPARDGLANSGKSKNIPCHMGFQGCVLGGRLDFCVYQRSLDTIVGLPYDILLYGLLNMAMASTLGVSKGRVSIAFGDTHIYDSHFDIARKLIDGGSSQVVSQEKQLSFCSPNIDEVVLFPDKYVSDVIDAMSGFRYYDYAPVPEVVL